MAPKPGQKSLHLNIDADLKKQAQALALEEERTLTDVIEEALRDFLAKNTQKDTTEGK